MPHTLIAYSSVDGQTLKICTRIQRVLEDAGRTVALLEIGARGACDAAQFDTIVVGASIRYGRHRTDVYRFIESNREILGRTRSAFFSVNVVARKAGKDAPDSNPYVRAFCRKTTWRPDEIGVFAGRIDYPRYGFIDRQVIRFIMWLTDGPTDPATCTEFTDWVAVDRFAHRVLDL